MSSLYTIRFTGSEFPAVNAIVIARITEVNDLGVYVELLEYGLLAGYVSLAELSRTRLRKISVFIKPGNLIVVVVLEVDPTKRYVTLSKHRVTQQETEDSLKKFMDIKRYLTILHNYYREDSSKLQMIYETLVWRTCEDLRESLLLYPELEKELKDEIERRTAEKIVKDTRFIEITCFTEHGIEAIKQALTYGLEISDNQVEIVLIKTPCFRITSETVDLDMVVGAISEKIAEFGGNLAVVERTVVNPDD